VLAVKHSQYQWGRAVRLAAFERVERARREVRFLLRAGRSAGLSPGVACVTYFFSCCSNSLGSMGGPSYALAKSTSGMGMLMG
jgi:hypothetical protein